MPEATSPEPPELPAKLAFEPGDVVAGFRIESLLGRGGQAAVYCATDLHLERRVALKVLAEGTFARSVDGDTTAWFRREIDAVKQLEHPNVVRLYNFGSDGDVFWMAMELIDGASVRELVGREGSMEPERAVDIAQQVLEGLALAHDKGVVHCDLKPDNVMLARRGISRDLVKILDFGIGQLLTEHLEESDWREGTAGTPRYLAPERLLGAPPDARTDIYAVGLLLIEMLGGDPPFEGETDVEVLSQVAAGAVSVPERVHGTRLGEVIRRATALEPFDRFESAAAMHRALAEVAFVPEPTDDGTRRDSGGVSGRLVVVLLFAAIIVTTIIVVMLRPATELERDERLGVRPGDIESVSLAAPQGAVAGAAGTVVAWKPDVEGTAPRPALRIGMTPMVDATLLRDELEPIRAYLSRKLERDVVLVSSESYADMAEGVLEGETEVGLFTPMLYVRSEQGPGGDQLEVLAFEKFDGASTSDAYLLVREDEDARDLSALTGRAFCFTDRDSTTGYNLPIHWLRSQGRDPEAFVGEIHWSGSHLQVMRDLIDGKCDVAATYSGAYFSARDNDIPIGRMRIFEVIGRSPQTAVVAGPAASRRLRKQLRDALLAFEPESHADGRKRIGETLRITGYAPGDESIYDTLRAIERERSDGERRQR